MLIVSPEVKEAVFKAMNPSVLRLVSPYHEVRCRENLGIVLGYMALAF
jgi:hypothetical protein